MNKTDAIDIIFKDIPADAPAICTTGMITREVFTTHDRPNNFYMIGSMGQASSIGIGIALNKPGLPVFVFDGDGSALMSLGNFPLIGYLQLENFYHIILDNETYSSTGGQKTISSDTILANIAKSSGYKTTYIFTEPQELADNFRNIIRTKGPVCVLIKVEPGTVKGIARVSYTPEEIHERFKNELV